MFVNHLFDVDAKLITDIVLLIEIVHNLKNGEKKWRHLRLMIIGNAGHGKTTLVRHLLENNQIGDVINGTEGIDLFELEVNWKKHHKLTSEVQNPEERALRNASHAETRTNGL